MKTILASAMGLAIVFAASAYAAPMTLGGVNFDDSNGVIEAKLAAGGSLSGLTPGDDIDQVEGFDLGSHYELINNGTADDDVLSLLFANPIVNGVGNCIESADEEAGPASAADYAGCDLLIFEVFNQSDSPTAALSLAAAQLEDQPSPPDSILGVRLAFIDGIDVDGDGNMDDEVTIWGFDLMLLGLALGESATNPLFVGRDQGTPDIAAIVGVNFEEIPDVPLPAAAWLFMAGAAGFGFAGWKKKIA